MTDEAFKVAYERVEKLLDTIRRRQFSGASHQAIDLIDVSSHILATELRRIARNREVNDDDAISIQNQIDEKAEGEFRHWLSRLHECLSPCEAAALFRVENLAGRTIDVIAANESCAGMLAARVRHVEAEKNAKVRRYKADYIDKLRRTSPALWQAIRAGLPGVVSKVGNHVIVKGKNETVYGPINVVD